MFSGIRISNNKIENLKMIKNETQGSISLLDGRIRTKAEFWKHGRNGRDVKCDLVDQGMIRAVIHGGETEIQLDTGGSYRLRDWDDGDECGVVDFMVGIDGTGDC